MIKTKQNKPEVIERYYQNYYEYTLFSPEEIEKLEAINQHFVFMQNYLRDKIVSIAKVFRKMSKKEFPYL